MKKSKHESKDPNFKIFVICLIVGACIAVSYLAAFTFLFQYGFDSAMLEESNSSHSRSTSLRPFVSSKYGFAATFAGEPTTSTSKLDIDGVDVPYTTYERDNGDRFYEIVVFEYPPTEFDLSDTDARLEDGINGSVQNIRGGKLLHSEFGQLAGYRAITGTIAAPTDGETIYINETIFIKGNTMFLIQSSGASEHDFNEFRKSFEFIK